MKYAILTIEIAAIVAVGVAPRVEAQLLEPTAERCALLGSQLVAQPDSRTLICRSFDLSQLHIEPSDPSNRLAPQPQDRIVIERYDEQNRIVSAVGIDVYSDGAKLVTINEHQHSWDSASISTNVQMTAFYLEDGYFHRWPETEDTAPELMERYRSDITLLLDTLEAQPRVEPKRRSPDEVGDRGLKRSFRFLSTLGVWASRPEVLISEG